MLVSRFPKDWPVTSSTSVAGSVAVLAVVLAGAGVGCATTGQVIESDDATVRIDVVNNNFQDATLYALWTGQRSHLGIVPGKGEATYVLPWPRSFELQIEIDLLAGDRCTTRGIVTDPGDDLWLEIRSELSDDPDCVR